MSGSALSRSWGDLAPLVRDGVQGMVRGLIEGDLWLRSESLCRSAKLDPPPRLLLARRLRGTFSVQTAVTQRGRIAFFLTRTSTRAGEVQVDFEVRASSEPSRLSRRTPEFYYRRPQFVRRNEPRDRLTIRLRGGNSLWATFGAYGEVASIGLDDGPPEQDPTAWPMILVAAWLDTLAYDARQPDAAEPVRVDLDVDQPGGNRGRLVGQMLESLRKAIENPPEEFVVPLTRIEPLPGAPDPLHSIHYPRAYQLDRMRFLARGWFRAHGALGVPKDTRDDGELGQLQQVDVEAAFERRSTGNRVTISSRPSGIHVDGEFRSSLIDALRRDSGQPGFFSESYKHLFEEPHEHDGPGRRSDRREFRRFVDSPSQDQGCIVVRYDSRRSALVMLRGSIHGRSSWLLLMVTLEVDQGRVVDAETKIPLGGSASGQRKLRTTKDWRRLCSFFNWQLATHEAWRRRMKN